MTAKGGAEILVDDGELESVWLPDLMVLVPAGQRAFAERYGWRFVRAAVMGFAVSAGIEMARSVLGSIFA